MDLTKENKFKEEYLESIEREIIKQTMLADFYQSKADNEKDKQKKAEFQLKVNASKDTIKFNKDFVDFYNA